MLNGRAGTAGVTKRRTRFLVDEERSAVGGLIAGREHGLTGDARQRREAAEKREDVRGSDRERKDGRPNTEQWMVAGQVEIRSRLRRGDD